jgi:molybdopterin-guanine dinucleotide biosynthesis protein A
MPADYAVIVLAGGRSRRMGGVDKCAQRLGDRSLLDHVIEAADSPHVVVVGPRRPTVRPVVWTRESPSGSGPVAGLQAGLDHVAADLAVVLAGDAPFVGSAVPRLVARARRRDVDAALLVDGTGQVQYLVGAYWADPLRAALQTEPRPSSMRALVARLDVRTVAASGAEAFDCDTQQDLRQAREMVTGAD